MERRDVARQSYRYRQAHEILFGEKLDLDTRFDVKEYQEKGTILLNKIFNVYQAGTGEWCDGGRSL